MTTKLIPIVGQVQAYQWGGFDYLPKLLQYANTERQPQAEYWLGVHPAAPAMTREACGSRALTDVLDHHHCELNFLLKILDVRDMLSIQVHPSKAQAEVGFARENQLGIPLTAKNRNYKDANHKPELLVALSEFWLLHGFSNETDISARMRPYPYLQPLLKTLTEQGLSAAFVLALSASDSLVEAMHTALKIDFAERPPITDQSVIEFWIQRWLSSNPDAVAGLLTLFFLNLVKLSPGQGMYQPDGLLHAYLEGQNIELMANSDNVLRAGLTPKHIDVPELLDVCSIQPTQPSDYLISPQADGQGITVFPTPFHEFELSRVDIQSHLPCAWPACNAEILLIMDGTATVACGDQSYELRCGEAIAILPEAGAVTVSTSSQSQIYRARNL